MERGKMVRLGTRGSALARRQTDIIRSALERRVAGLQIAVEIIETRGDRVQDRPISEIGDKGVFIRAIESRLLDASIDLAVHSLKDVPADLVVPELTLAAFSEREDPRDVVVSNGHVPLMELPPGARIGTSSPRRRALLASIRPDLIPTDIRGNVDTRLRKLRERQYDAIILAAAGLHRLGLQAEITEYLPLETWLPDAGQGIMTVQGRVDDATTAIAWAIDCPGSRAAAAAERAVARALDADCHTPIGALAQIEGGLLTLHAVAAHENLRDLQRADGRGPVAEAVAIGNDVGRRLAAQLRENRRLY